jgi:hypothetical protein
MSHPGYKKITAPKLFPPRQEEYFCSHVYNTKYWNIPIIVASVFFSPREPDDLKMDCVKRLQEFKSGINRLAFL